MAERTDELTKERQQLVQTNQELASAINSLSIAHEELVRSEKLAALGSLVAGVAHELNTLIGSSLTVVSTLVEKTRQFAEQYANGLKRSEVERYIDDSILAGDTLMRNIVRAADLVTSFKQVAVDQTSSQRRRFSLVDVISENIAALTPTIKNSHCRVELAIPTQISMDSYPGPLCQVLINLVNNAIIHGFDTMDAGMGLISISAIALQDNQIELRISDNGVGIAPEHLKRIYDPFFTTRLGAGGSGLGLNITHNIVSGVLGGKKFRWKAPWAWELHSA